MAGTSPTSVSLKPDLKAYAEVARREDGYSSFNAYVEGLIRRDRFIRHGRRYREIMAAASPEERAGLEALHRGSLAATVGADAELDDIGQGEVRVYLDDRGADTGVRVVVVSGNESNAIVVPVRQGDEDLPPFLVLLDDPLVGQANCGHVSPQPARNLGGVVGLASLATMDRICSAIGDLARS